MTDLRAITAAREKRIRRLERWMKSPIGAVERANLDAFRRRLARQSTVAELALEGQPATDLVMPAPGDFPEEPW